MSLDRHPRQELDHYEQIIERGLLTFVEVGRALLAIKTEKLYRETHRTWEAYCRERWGFSQQHAGRVISASEVAGLLATEPQGSLPSTEKQARALAPLRDDPAAMSAAWEEAVEKSETGEPTAREVADVVEMKKPRRTRAHEIKEMTEDERERCPYCGQDLPDRLQIPPSKRRETI